MVNMHAWLVNMHGWSTCMVGRHACMVGRHACMVGRHACMVGRHVCMVDLMTSIHRMLGKHNMITIEEKQRLFKATVVKTTTF